MHSQGSWITDYRANPVVFVFQFFCCHLLLDVWCTSYGLHVCMLNIMTGGVVSLSYAISFRGLRGFRQTCVLYFCVFVSQATNPKYAHIKGKMVGQTGASSTTHHAPKDYSKEVRGRVVEFSMAASFFLC